MGAKGPVFLHPLAKMENLFVSGFRLLLHPASGHFTDLFSPSDQIWKKILFAEEKNSNLSAFFAGEGIWHR
jgi:hypothetical protein